MIRDHTPENEMPQVEYWGRDFGISGDETSLAQLDAMTLKVTPLRPMQTVILEFEAL